jgi:predicted kinase
MKAYITIGIPASGKSTWAAQQEGLVNINLDDCRKEICGDEGNQSVTPQAVQLHDQKIKAAASQQLDIVISDTNLNTKFRNELEQKLISLGYQVEYVLFPVSLEVAKTRNQNRSRVVPDYVLDKMLASYQAGVPAGNLVVGNTLIPEGSIPQLNQLVN